MFPRVALKHGQRSCARDRPWPFPLALHDRRGGIENTRQMFRQQMFRHLSSSSGSPPDTATWLPRDPALIVAG